MELDQAIQAAANGTETRDIQVGSVLLHIKEVLGVFDHEGHFRIHGRIVCPKEYPGEEVAYMAIFESTGKLISLDHKMEGSFPSPMPELIGLSDDYQGLDMKSHETKSRIAALPKDSIGHVITFVILRLLLEVFEKNRDKLAL